MRLFGTLSRPAWPAAAAALACSLSLPSFAPATSPTAASARASAALALAAAEAPKPEAAPTVDGKCRRCDGSGLAGLALGGAGTCPECKGTGKDPKVYDETAPADKDGWRWSPAAKVWWRYKPAAKPCGCASGCCNGTCADCKCPGPVSSTPAAEARIFGHGVTGQLFAPPAFPVRRQTFYFAPQPAFGSCSGGG